ncbi:dTMP kinase [Mycoplasmopsis columbina]|uniref:dTMP kinase n=1 Tax=Mycoplasmopsis columbina TaxID=114881 RepID=UPI0004A703A9|nr:dTMP kinase [Mycoplasmopsis columbina]VEU76990.1 Thymidylate kinase [Mycoplasmopsis columbina]
MFITFEGPDGSGKTTILKLLVAKLEKTFPNLKLLLTREPGGKKVLEAEKIREIILNKESKISPITEALLYTASRRIHLDQVIIPALKRNELILCDRYVDSFYAYQGFARELGFEFTSQLTNLVIDNIMPKITFFFDIKPEESKKRRCEIRGEQNRLDQENDDFHRKVYEGYWNLIKQEPDRFIVIDASKSVEEVFEETYRKLTENLEFKQYIENLK